MADKNADRERRRTVEGESGRAPDETILVARATTLEARLFTVALVAPAAVPADDKPVPAARLASAGVRCRQPLHVTPQLAALVEAPHLLHTAHVPAADENPRQGRPRFPRHSQDPPQLVHEGRVHGDVTLVQRHAEGPQDSPHGLAVLEGAADDPEAGEVDHDGLLCARDPDLGGGSAVRQQRRVGEGEGAEESLGAAVAVADGGGGAYISAGGAGEIVGGEEAPNVLEGGAREFGGGGVVDLSSGFGAPQPHGVYKKQN
ncbi:polynucleotidyl transferase [Striga asiatica]|uniref:Polynucleotidyl transferase n=1 Tax=Striga asiatica TaxID=4170 RepID=A0A5A7NYS8_STRAF|nr:polynucleotidyl transferase [Striga asiatica]